MYNRENSLAPMSKRLWAYIIDSILLGIVLVGVILAGLLPFVFFARPFVSGVGNSVAHIAPMSSVAFNMMFDWFPRWAAANLLLTVLILGASNILTTIILWATNGYTPGKWLLQIKVLKINGSKISFLDALLREFIIKCVANGFCQGFLNLGSFIWGCVTEDHKTVHDLAAQTRVVEWDRSKRGPGPRSERYNPFES